jgi:hypothetical protein
MKHYFSLLTTAVCLVVFPGTGLAQKDAGIPPMLETQRPLSIPATQPEPRAPQVDTVKPVAPATKGAKTKKAQRKTNGGKTNVASKKKGTKVVKKKSATAKPRSKVAANH